MPANGKLCKCATYTTEMWLTPCYSNVAITILIARKNKFAKTETILYTDHVHNASRARTAFCFFQVTIRYAQKQTNAFSAGCFRKTQTMRQAVPLSGSETKLNDLFSFVRRTTLISMVLLYARSSTQCHSSGEEKGLHFLRKWSSHKENWFRKYFAILFDSERKARSTLINVKCIA